MVGAGAVVRHDQVSYPVGHLSTLYWIGVRPGDVHLAISAPGWAKHAWSCFFAPWIAEATIFVYNYARFDAAALLDQLHRAGVNTFCAPPTVWRMLIQADLGERPAGLREILGAGEPLGLDLGQDDGAVIHGDRAFGKFEALGDQLQIHLVTPLSLGATIARDQRRSSTRMVKGYSSSSPAG